MEVDKFKICRVGWQAGDTDGPVFQFESENHQAGEPGKANAPVQSVYWRIFDYLGKDQSSYSSQDLNQLDKAKPHY